MKNYLIQIIILLIGCGSIVYSQGTIKWEESFDNSVIPENWRIVDFDNSGSCLSLVQKDTTQDGTILTPQVGESFWVSNLQNCNRAGVIDEWLISPRISVIYNGDSLYFWAGSVGGLFNDSIKVKVSTTDNAIKSFEYELGYFKVDGPVGSWHKYGFDLSAYDSSDIYFAINYYVNDGGPGGANSDHVWIDHPIVTGDPSTINNSPTICNLKYPADYSSIDPTSQTIDFEWTKSHDLDEDILEYTLSILNVFPPMHFSEISDTILSLEWKELLNENTLYFWSVEVNDGKSYVTSIDTFAFYIGEPLSFDDNNSSITVHYELNQNYPNPFNPTSTIAYSVAKTSFVTLKVYDLLGEVVATLVNVDKPAGAYEVEFDASNLTSGVYFYRIQAGDFVETKKMLLLR